MFELHLVKGRVFVWGRRPGIRGHIRIMRAPTFYQGLDWQLHRQSEPPGIWNVQPIDEEYFVMLADHTTFCRKLDLADTDVGVGFVHIESFRTDLDIFLSPAITAGGGRSVYDQWHDAIVEATEGRDTEAVIRLNIGLLTDQEIAGYRDGLWLGTKDIDLEIRPRTFAGD